MEEIDASAALSTRLNSPNGNLAGGPRHTPIGQSPNATRHLGHGNASKRCINPVLPRSGGPSEPFPNAALRNPWLSDIRRRSIATRLDQVPPWRWSRVLQV